MARDTEHAQGADSDIQADSVLNLRHRIALIAEEHIRCALEASHVSSLLLRGLLNGIDRLLALHAVDDGFILAAAVDI